MFAALADPQRRRLLEELEALPRPVHALARGASISRSAVSQHLAVLREAGLVQAEHRGREVLYRRSEPGFVPAREWIARFRDVQLGRLPHPDDVPLHVSAVAVPVTDQDRARTFYVERLGFQLVTDRIVGGIRWISLLPPGGSCAVGLMRAPSAGIWTGVSLLTGDIMDVYHRWTQSGVAFDSPPARQAWGARAAIFADIDRNRFQLVEVPIDGGNPTHLATLRDPTVADDDFDPGLREP